MAGDFTISWLGQPFPTHHSSQQRWIAESKMIPRICMAHCTSQPDWKVPFLDIHPHISWSVYVDINLNCRCWQWWRRVKKLANLSTRKQWLVTHVFLWKQTKDLAFMTLISLLSSAKSGCRHPFHGNLCKTHQRMERWKKLREYLRVNFGNLKIPLELSKKNSYLRNIAFINISLKLEFVDGSKKSHEVAAWDFFFWTSNQILVVMNSKLLVFFCGLLLGFAKSLRVQNPSLTPLFSAGLVRWRCFTQTNPLRSVGVT